MTIFNSSALIENYTFTKFLDDTKLKIDTKAFAKLTQALLVGFISTSHPILVEAKVDVSTFKTFTDGNVYFNYPEDLFVSPKPVQTHDKEVYLKSDTIKGFNAGVTVRV